ncbi:MAG: hypothetical protein ACLVJ6_13095 [Merdibacter sp.]
MQENLQMFITLLGEEDARALVRILEKAIAFYQQHHGRLRQRGRRSYMLKLKVFEAVCRFHPCHHRPAFRAGDV